MQILRMNARRYHFFRSSADRPNLTYQVRLKDDTKDNVIEDMVKYIKENHNDSSGIVYAYSKKEADQIADQFVERGIIAASYHSKVSPTEKESIHRGWMQNHIQVVVATIAFGL
jgi:ATP-dependent DNA helicase Q1